MLEIKNIHIKYNREVITDSNLILNDYGITVIKGESGSGKTSLIRNILFQEHQFEYYFYNEKEITSKNQIDHLFSAMDQKNLFIEDLKISEHFELLKKIYHSKSIDDYLERLEVKDTFNKYPGQLSGGEKNRISFLMCLLKNTPIIILDEPTAALDSYYTEEVKNIIVKESKDHLFIISTHDPVLFDIADTLYQIENKKLICLKYNEMKKEIEDKRLKQTVNIAKFFLKMKKHKLLSNILMLLILSISIVVTSLSAGYSLSDKNSHYDQVDSMVNKEVIVYKPIMQQHPYYFSGNSQESIISEEELNEIKKIKGVESINDYIEIGTWTKSYTTNNAKIAILTYDDKINRVISHLKANNSNVDVINARFFKPMDEKMLISLQQDYEHLIVYETDIRNASLGLYINEFYAQKNLPMPMTLLAIENHYTPQGTVDELLKLEKLNLEKLDEVIKKVNK